MDQTYKRNFLRAGALAREVRAFGKSLIAPGTSYNAIIAAINQKIVELGARPAFPPQIALNDTAAHFLPQPGEDIIFSDQVVKLDIGVCFQGAIGDCAVTVDLSGKHGTLVEAAEAALIAVEQSIRVGLTMGEVGAIIEHTAARFGLQPVRNLSGHGLGVYKIHTAPMVPNYNTGSKIAIRPGMTFAIEPFVTTGKGSIHEIGAATIFAIAKQRPVRSDAARAVLAKIKHYDGLPFAIHDLVDPALPLSKVQRGLVELLKMEVVHGYGPLVEEAHGMVAQAENSVLVDEDGQVTITTR